MWNKKILIIANFMLLFTVIGVSIMSAEEKNRDLRIEALIEEFQDLEDALPALELDSNDDGQVDYLIKTNESDEKMMEILDYNHDGKMDDFYIYENGVLRQRAIDSNFDTKIDIWVYLKEGVYISRYEEDSDYDGTMDVDKSYASEEKKIGDQN
ncbi:MAG: hypothetical protein ACOC2P_00160 [Spirochaetota bacterium]